MALRKAKRSIEEETAARLATVSPAFLSRLCRCDPSTITGFASSGCPRNADGTFDYFAVQDWLKRDGRGVFRAPAQHTQTDHRSAIDRFKALNAEAEYNERIGKLIPREEAERAQIRLALEFKASLMTLADQLPMQLANLPAREVEARLRERVAWMLGRSQDGHVPIPQALVDAIAKLVADLAAVEPAR